MSDKQVLKLALEALEEIHVGNMTPMAETNWIKAITAIRESLAQPEQEPVAWMGTDVEGNPNKFRLNFFSGAIPLFTTPEDRSQTAGEKWIKSL